MVQIEDLLFRLWVIHKQNDDQKEPFVYILTNVVDKTKITNEVIYFDSSIKLKKLFTPKDKFIPLPNQFHNGINDNPLYLKELTLFLK